MLLKILAASKILAAGHAMLLKILAASAELAMRPHSPTWLQVISVEGSGWASAARNSPCGRVRLRSCLTEPQRVRLLPHAASCSAYKRRP